MGEVGESSSSHQVYPPEVAYAPPTPAKPNRSDPNMIGTHWLKNQFDEVIYEETSAKKSIGCWEGNSGSTSQIYDISGGMYNRFSMDDVETWNSISCRDLLALADATIRKGSDDGGGGAEMSMLFGDRDRSNGLIFDNGTDTQQYGWLNLGRYSPDINLPPQTVTNPQVSAGVSSQFTPVTPDQARRAEEHKQRNSEIVAKPVADNNKERSNLDEQPQLLVGQLQADVSMLVEANQDLEKGLTAETNLNETPQPKQRRRKHRPKVVREGQPKKAKQSTTPSKPDGSSTGKRKYVRRKGVEKSPATPAVEEASGTIDTSTEQQNKKSCRKKINFDETDQGTEVMVEKTQVNITVDKTCSMNQVVETYETILESQSASPITPSKTELPIKDAKHTYRKAKCRINFLQETLDKGPSIVSSPNESNCRTNACFNREEAQGSKIELSSKIDGMELWDENAIGVGCNLSKFTNNNSGSKQGMHLPANKKKRIEKCQSSITSGAISSVCSAQESDCSFLAEKNAGKAPQMSKDYGLKDDQQSYRCNQAFEHPGNSTKKRSKALALVHDSASFPGMIDGRHWQTPQGASRYKVSYQQQTYMEAHAADFQVSIATKKRMKKTSMLSSLYHDHLHLAKGCIDSLINQFERLDINSQMAEEGRDALIPYLSRYNEKNALVLYQERGLVPFEGVFNPVKKRKPRPKVDLDDETSRVWRLLLENINNQGIDGTDEDKAKWWEEERRVFRGRADSFIARMHLVQGDRRFSRWKGSVLDSVIGVFLTQNVSDHLSSSAFMSLAARFPLKSKSSSGPLHDDESILFVKEPCQVDQDETIGWHEEKSNEPPGDHCVMMLQETDPCEEKEVVNSNEFSKNSSCVDLNVSSECEIPELSEKDLAMYKDSVVDQIEVDDRVSSHNSANMSPRSVQSPIAHTTERLGSCSKEEQKDMSKATTFGGSTSFVELLHMQGTTTVHETYSQQQAEESSNKKIGQDELESLAYLEEQNDGISPHSNSLGALEVESFELRGEQNIIQKKSEEECASEESGISAESASQATVQMVKTTSSQEAAKSCNTFHTHLQERSHCKVIAVNPKINTEQHTDNNECEVQEVLDIANVFAENSKATKSINIVKASEETVHKVVEVNPIDHGTQQIVTGMDEGTSKVKRQKSGKMKEKVEWDSLRLQAEVQQKRERTPNTSDSLDYEAVRSADVNEVADTIKERGMNNVLAARIKDLLDRLVQDHGSIDLEWLRDVPPDKAKEYLLSFRGLGLKSVECVRLLTLHHLAFPVDTNVGRIAVRLGWVPLQPLPESLQLHLLELYPVLESIQKYLWPRLCKLDQRTLYELHYQMITFGKVFCTKSKPNCNACPMRGECRHFASAFASARLGLPAPEERMASLTENRTGQTSIGLIDQCHITLPPASEQLQQLSEVQNCNSVIEEPATTGTIVEVPATPGTIVEVPATPGPIVEVPEMPGPIIEVPATPEPEPIQQEEFDIEDFCEDSEEIPMIKLNIEEFTQNLQTYMEKHMVLGEGDMSKALVALTSEAAAIPTPKLKNVSQLRTEHQVYELPDSHPLLEGLDTREPDDPCSYLLAIWTPGETADSIQPPGGQCRSQESGTLCCEETCFFCNSTREANSQTVRGTLLIPCRTAMRGSFPLNGTYFQVNEVFADHESSLNPIDVPRSWLWNLPRRTVYFGTSIPTIFKGLTTEDIQYCFWRGFVCVRGFDQKTRAPRPLMARLHFPASRLKRSRPMTGGN